MLQVSWLRDGAAIRQSGRVHYSHSQGQEFSLRLRSVSASDLGNYTCSLSLGASTRQLDSATILLDKRPPPPLFVGLKDGVNQSSQLLTWTGNIELQLTFLIIHSPVFLSCHAIMEEDQLGSMLCFTLNEIALCNLFIEKDHYHPSRHSVKVPAQCLCQERAGCQSYIFSWSSD